MNTRLNINDEFSPLKRVVVGIADDRGNVVHENNPKISKYLTQGSFPTEHILKMQVESLVYALEINGVEVLRPENIISQDQIFARDIAFVIGDKLIKSNMKKENRQIEQQGIEFIINRTDSSNVLELPKSANIEGGDVIIHNKYIFVGLSSRTNYLGYEFIKSSFPDYEVIPFQLWVSDNPSTNILHLDCAFQPFGGKFALIYENGFVHYPDAIIDIFGSSNLIKVNQYEMYHMNPNIFSISPEKLITDQSFERINNIFNSLGIETIKLHYQEVAKLGGLFRCSTLPLERV